MRATATGTADGNISARLDFLGYRESPSLETWNKYIHPNDVAAAAEAEK